MSSQQKRVELLTFGYVNKTYSQTVPVQLIKLMQLFYDQSMYWIIKDEKLKEFQNKKNGQCIMCSKTYKIKGIKFNILVYPNGTKCNDNFVRIGLQITHWPNDIVSVRFYQETKCDQTNNVTKILMKLTKNKSAFRSKICPSFKLKNMNIVCFSVFIDIKHIKYKKRYHKINYYSPINKMNKHYKFTWNINGLLLDNCKKMICKQPLYSENFDINNWCLILFPNTSSDYQGQIVLNCLCLPYKVNSMDVRFTLFVNSNFVIEQTVSFKDGMFGPVTLDKVILFARRSLLIGVELKILRIYDENGERIKENKWERHGIIDSKLT